MDRAPSGFSNADSLKKHIARFNQLLSDHTDGFSQSHSDTAVIYFDAHYYFEYYLDHASQYGFTNTTGYCANDTKPAGCLPLDE